MLDHEGSRDRSSSRSMGFESDRVYADMTYYCVLQTVKKISCVFSSHKSQYLISYYHSKDTIMWDSCCGRYELMLCISSPLPLCSGQTTSHRIKAYRKTQTKR